MLDWNNLDVIKEIKKTYGNKHSAAIIDQFINFGKSTMLDVFKREIWLTDNGTIMIGRDGYRKIAQSHPDYDYHQYDAVYENDDFKIVNGEICHSYGLKNRGNLVGGYCIAKRKSSSKAIYVYVSIEEYNKKRNNWASMPATMICKVAEGHVLRKCFNDLFRGTYNEGEIDESPVISANKKPSAEVIPMIKSDEVYEEKATDKQVSYLYDLLKKAQLSSERIKKAFSHYHVERIEDLTHDHADHFSKALQKIVIGEAS